MNIRRLSLSVYTTEGDMSKYIGKLIYDSLSKEDKELVDTTWNSLNNAIAVKTEIVMRYRVSLNIMSRVVKYPFGTARMVWILNGYPSSYILTREFKKRWNGHTAANQAAKELSEYYGIYLTSHRIKYGDRYYWVLTDRFDRGMT